MTEGATTTAQATTTAETTKTTDQTTTTGTMAGDGGSASTTASTTTTQPDWRVAFATGPDGKPDDKALERLKRFNSQGDMWKSYRELETKVTSGQLAKPTPFPDKGTDEEKAAWRKERGVPDKPEDYKLPDGVQVAESDKAILGEFFKAAHQWNRTPEEVQATVGWYFEARQEAAASQMVKDRETWTETERELKQKWGSEDFETNKAIYKNFLSSAPESVRDALNAARGPDGRKLGGNPEFLEWAIGLARTVNPLHTVVPAGGTGGIDSVESEIAKIEKVMREDRSAYNRDEGMQARLRKLYAAREAVKGKAA